MNVDEMPLVTILTPCYNTGKYIHRLLNSVIEQDYPKIQMIVVDDGSTDNSAEVIKSFTSKFKARGFSLEYYYQENGGQSMAINNGLKRVLGDYLLWPDSDDFYKDNDTISLLVDTLANLPSDYAMARTWINYVNDETLKEFCVIGPGMEEANFDNCLFCKNFYFSAGSVIVDFDKLKEVTSLDIFVDKDAGQNWQLYLPVLHKYKCKTIQQAKYNVLCRADSHSRGHYKSLKQTIARIDSYEKTLLATLDAIKSLADDSKDDYKIAIRKKYAIERYGCAVNYNARKYAIKYAAELKSCGIRFSLKESLKYWLLWLNLFGVYQNLNRLVRVQL